MVVLMLVFVIELGGRSNHAFRFGVGFFFLKLVLFSFTELVAIFAFGGIVRRCCGIFSGKASFFRRTRGFLGLCISDMLGQHCRFFRA